MKDIQGRNIDYMRISITDRCNLRCKYCMPEGIDWVRPREILSLEEICQVAVCGAGMGIRHLKITGGEPLVRKDCCRLVEMLKAVPGIETVTITTNGVLLKPFLEPLKKAGIDGINVSLDTLDRNLYQEITGQDRLEQVLEAIRQAAEQGIRVKINAVAVQWEDGRSRRPSDKVFPDALKKERSIPCDLRTKGSAARNWRELAELAWQLPVDVRFIEMMPVGYGKAFKAADPEEMLEEIRREHPGTERDSRIHGYGPAVYYHIPGFLGSIGVIRAMHGKFCSECNRIRLTAQGWLKGCLCYEEGADLRVLLRQGEKSMQQNRLKEAMEKVIREKPASHCFEKPEGMTEKRGMSSIGG